ncbi:uncharacterized protein LOC108705944 [Xenopus laevis]|uniref:Uncharacterized protein LOC108705944 n=1 Tax=Xenopus laevis TaxID=8355 RepID=A0A8J0TZC8_XENLA|nr:uncharacterized protein LOC108705944 [Xenopus laevis]
MGKSKLSPKPAHTIPRLELCAAVLAVELYELIRDEIDIDLDAVRFFTDSKTVFGYICNTSRRFFLYVANRVNRIRQVTHPDQWIYVPTEQNPADYASRPTQTVHLQNSIWFSGPSFLYHTDREELGNSAEKHPLIEPEADPEIKPTVASFNTKASDTFLHSHVFERLSNWVSLCKTIARLIHVAKSFQKEPSNVQCRDWKCFPEKVNSEEISQSKATIISSVQHEYSKREYLSNLQSRRKWTQNRPDIQVGDVVLVKDSQESRNEWHVGLIINTLPSRDGRVRKVEVKIVKQGTAKTYMRPVSDIVVLLSDNT